MGGKGAEEKQVYMMQKISKILIFEGAPFGTAPT